MAHQLAPAFGDTIALGRKKVVGSPMSPASRNVTPTDIFLRPTVTMSGSLAAKRSTLVSPVSVMPPASRPARALSPTPSTDHNHAVLESVRPRPVTAPGTDLAVSIGLATLASSPHADASPLGYYIWV